MQIPFVDLKAQFGPLKVEVMQALEDCLDSMHLFLGPNTQAFEQEFATYCGTSHAIGVGNGTDALHLALRAVGVGAGDEVITVAHTFFATVEAIFMAGARPVFVDIDPITFTMDASQLEAKITPRTKAIIPVHLYGRLANMDAIMAIARRHDLRVVEDAAQAHGAEAGGRRAGAIGDLGCFSFYFSKNLGAYGEGGAVVTADPELARRVRLLRDHGSEVRYHHDLMGFNARLDEVQAAILRIKLRHLDAWNEQRQRHALSYDEALADAGVQRPNLPADRSHVYHLYVVRCEQRDEVKEALARQGIGTGIHYPIPVHLQVASRSLGYKPGDLPETESAAQTILSLPMYPELTDEQIGYVAGAVRTARGRLVAGRS